MATSWAWKEWRSCRCRTSKIQMSPFFPALMRAWCWGAYTTAALPSWWHENAARQRYLIGYDYTPCLSTQPPTYFIILHFSDIPRILRSSISKQLFVPKRKLKTGKWVSVVVIKIWNRLPSTIKSPFIKQKLKTYNCKFSVVQLSNDDSWLPHLGLNLMILLVAPLSLNIHWYRC